MATMPSENRNWEVVFSTWGQAPSASEQEKCERAERAIRNAIGASEKLRSKTIEVFVQGSYANRTNVRQESDVDVCVLYKDAFFPNYQFSQGLSDQVLRLVDGKYPYAEFKNEVEAALKDCFGAEAYVRGKKAFTVHANTYRIHADVVPCFEHRRYGGTVGNVSVTYGTQLIPDGSRPIVNWPKQNYDNGVSKNEATGRRFKAVVRILKRLRNEMLDNGHIVAQPIPSYLIECFVWNAPDTCFGNSTLREDVRAVLAFLWRQTLADDTCNEWGEINELKYLFRDGQPWNRQQVNDFLLGAWNYIGFK